VGAQFLPAFNNTIGYEGIYSCDPTDAGGETVYGLCRRDDSKWAGWARVDHWKTQPIFPSNMKGDEILLNLAQEYFKNNYWSQIHGDDISNQDIANLMFDIAVNQGDGNALEWLKKTLDSLSLGQKGVLYPALSLNNGVVTSAIIDTLNIYLQTEDPWFVLISLRAWRLVGHESIALADPNDLDDTRGWINRDFLRP